MNKIVYYVAISLDGYICGSDDDISGFIAGGNGVERYLADLKDFKTVIMGRRTYEFGYQYGLKPGDLPYPHMDHFIFSNTLRLENANPKIAIKKLNLGEIDAIRSSANSDIYLCGGGLLAGWLLEHQQIDILKVKLNPMLIGEGTRLFGASQKAYQLELLQSDSYDNGLFINEYAIQY